MNLSNKTSCPPNRLWTKEELAALCKHYPEHGSTWDGWEQLLNNRTVWAIRERARRIGVVYNPRWTKEEVEVLKECYPRHIGEWTEEQWHKVLPGRSKVAIRQKAGNLGIRIAFSCSEHHQRWTKSDDAKLLKAIQIIATQLGRTERSVVNRASMILPRQTDGEYYEPLY